MSTLHTGLTRRVTDRDFLLGSVWEGTGDELHTNRFTAAAGLFGGRVLSGISGMLLTIGTHDPDLLWSAPGTLEWSFDAPIFEGSDLVVSATPEGRDHVLAGSLAGNTATRGRIGFGPGGVARPVEGTSTRGRTMTRADVDLFLGWIPPRSVEPAGAVPWPLLVLTASGLVNRSDYLGNPHPETVLNRGLRWTFGERLAVEETVHCIVGPVQQRRSASRPGFRVATFRVAVVASESRRTVAAADWVAIIR
ncbi:hypothetical protein [Pseudonocardia sp. DLS-67]